MEDRNPNIKRPMIWICIAFMLGITSGVYSARNGMFVPMCIVLSVLFVMGAVACLIKRKAYIAMVCVISIAVAFFYSYELYSQRYAVEDISVNESIVSANVLDISKFNDNSVRYELDELYINGEKVNSGMMLTVENGELKVGENITFVAHVTKPVQSRNSKVFDYREYLANKGIYYTAYIKIEDVIEKNDHSGSILLSIKYGLRAFKHNMADKYGKYLSVEAMGIVNAITLGDDLYIKETQYENYRKSGTAHVLAISGLHVGFAVAFAGLITKRLKRYGKAYTLINILFVWLYIVISGCNISAVRAGLFFTLFSIGYYMRQRNNILNTACVTALIMLMIDPLMMFTASFQLSFSAVVSIGILQGRLSRYIMGKLKLIPENAVKTFSTAVCASIGVILPIAYHFNSLSLVSVLINLVMIPLFAYIVGFAFSLLVAVMLDIGIAAKILSYVVNGLVFISDSLLDITLEWKYSSITVASPGALMLVAGAALISVLSIEKPLWINRKIAAVVCCVLIAAGIAFPYTGISSDYRISFIDVGQAECSLIVTPTNKTVMIDAGTSYGGDGAAEYTIVPYLLKHGNNKIDYLVISHMHDDHMGEVEDILGMITVENIVFFAPDESIATKTIELMTEEYGISLINMYYNRNIVVDKTTSLQRLSTYFDDEDVNDQSLVMDVVCSSRHLIFSGDASAEILDNTDHPDDIFIYKVAHHGSKTAYSDVLMHKLPKFSVICTKEGNHYNLPNADTLELYNEYSLVLQTAVSGEICFTFDDESYSLYKYFDK